MVGRNRNPQLRCMLIIPAGGGMSIFTCTDVGRFKRCRMSRSPVNILQRSVHELDVKILIFFSCTEERSSCVDRGHVFIKEEGVLIDIVIPKKAFLDQVVV